LDGLITPARTCTFLTKQFMLKTLNKVTANRGAKACQQAERNKMKEATRRTKKFNLANEVDR